MEVEFDSIEWLNFYLGNYSGKQKFSEAILKKYRDKINIISEAFSIVELSKVHSLNIEKFQDHWSARINDQFRIEFEFLKPNTIVVLKISKHYE